MAFLGSFLQYAIIMVILAAIALAGFFAGKKLRENKDAKAAAEADTAAEQEVPVQKILEELSREEILR